MTTEAAKFVTTFTLTSPTAALPALEAIRAAGHQLRIHPALRARGMNLDTNEAYETWQTTMPLADVELIAVEAPTVTEVMPTAEEWQ